MTAPGAGYSPEAAHGAPPPGDGTTRPAGRAPAVRLVGYRSPARFPARRISVSARTRSTKPAPARTSVTTRNPADSTPALRRERSYTISALWPQATNPLAATTGMTMAVNARALSPVRKTTVAAPPFDDSATSPSRHGDRGQDDSGATSAQVHRISRNAVVTAETTRNANNVGLGPRGFVNDTSFIRGSLASPRVAGARRRLGPHKKRQVRPSPRSHDHERSMDY